MSQISSRPLHPTARKAVRAMRVARAVLFIVIVVYLCICAFMYTKQRSMQYRPNSSPMNPASAGLMQAEVQTLNTSDGERVVSWWIAPRDSTQPVFLYFHGNGAHLENRAQRFAKLTASGAGLLALSWRGYGGSSGTPSEAGLMNDARAALQHLLGVRKIASDRIVLFGESLGTTVAVMLASEVEVSGLLLDSSFDSALDVAERAYPWLPVSWLLRDQFRADLEAPNVRAPVQQVHCRDDPVTPLASAVQLHARFERARPLYVVDRRCHVPPFDAFVQVAETFARSLRR